MLIRPFDLFTAQDATGPELDIGELVTFLNDAIFFAPSMLLGPAVSWRAAGDDAFDVSLTDGGRTVMARVSLDGGAPRDFDTTDWFLEDPRIPKHPLIRGRWTTPVARWQEVDGRPVLAAGKAIWHLPGLAFTYAEMAIVPGLTRLQRSADIMSQTQPDLVHDLSGRRRTAEMPPRACWYEPRTPRGCS